MPLRLVPIDRSLLDAHRRSEAELQARLGGDIGPAAEVLGPVLEQVITLIEARPRAPEWGCFLAIDVAGRRLVGTCGFKDGPGADGSVELAYFTFPPYEGRGHATAMASELRARACDRPVIAHTLPERNASCRVLEKAGFIHIGTFDDPEDGPVWRWRAEGRG
ncbi:GNAT family N-acetyltransferase [Tundrisphaera sp. TA3]|uniref:GNAT family N-acetyltransferase n=1 Tax=Tundrisphaera sp. TA3 TaxID=3435775 RepID=UPI003EB6B5CE